MRFGSTSVNVGLLSLFTIIASVTGMFYFNYSVENMVVAILSFYVYNILGNWLMLHRYFSHKVFEFKNEPTKWIFIILSVLSARGSPIGWTYLHRLHHTSSDTTNDPHSPKYLGYKLFGFGHYKSIESEKMKVFLVKDLMTPSQLFIHKFYILLIFSFVLLLGLINIELLYFAWILPVTAVNISQNNFNYFGHMYGYRNFNTKDDSRNNLWLFPFILGEAWHNNHHHNPGKASTKISKYEFDPLTSVINLIGYQK